MASRWTGLALAATVLAGGCNERVTGPGGGEPIRITVTQNPTFAAGIAVFSVNVENISASTVNLTFPSSCQVLPYFFDPLGHTVTPVGGGFACLTVFTNHSLRPGASFSQNFTVKPGTTSEPGYVILPPGDYTVRGHLEDTVYRLVSDPVRFGLQ
jgi:hypothetical protein